MFCRAFLRKLHKLSTWIHLLCFCCSNSCTGTLMILYCFFDKNGPKTFAVCGYLKLRLKPHFHSYKYENTDRDWTETSGCRKQTRLFVIVIWLCVQCAVGVVQYLFRCDHILYTIVAVSGKQSLENSFRENSEGVSCSSLCTIVTQLVYL